MLMPYCIYQDTTPSIPNINLGPLVDFSLSGAPLVLDNTKFSTGYLDPKGSGIYMLRHMLDH